MIVLVRHGETEWNVEGRLQGHLDSPLTEKGREQVVKLKSVLKHFIFDEVYASPCKRVRETVGILKPRPLVIYDSRLKEMCAGIYEGVKRKDIPSELDRYDNWFFHWEGAESYNDVYLRLLEFSMGRHLEEKKDILLIAHEMVNKIFIGLHLGLDFKRIIQMRQPNGLLWLLP